MPLSYEQRFTPLTAECDPWARMTPGAVLRRVQEISIEHCDVLDINTPLAQKGAVFLLSRTSVRAHGMPVKGQRVRMETVAYGPQRAVWPRTTTLYGADEGVLCEVDTRWVLVDMQARRILRRPPTPLPFPEESAPAGHDMRLPKPETAPDAGQCHRAAYSLCDTNGHMNNTRYADLVCDALPLECWETGGLTRLLLSFHSEIPLGASFLLQSAPAGGGTYFLAAGGTAKHFEAWASFAGG